MRTLLLLLALVQPNNYRHATVISVHDGDTVTLAIELGAGTGSTLTLATPCRLAGIDARELSDKPGGQLDRDHLATLLGPNAAVVVELLGEDKYGRQLGRLYKGELDVNAKMIEDGNAKPYFGGAR